MKHVLLERRWDVLRHGLADAHAAGLAAQPLILVYWERRFAEPLERVRAELGIRVLGRAADAIAAAA
ncbi:MAG: Coq4 family protein [Myxococcota bacterium]